MAVPIIGSTPPPALLPAELRAQLRGLQLRPRHPRASAQLGLHASRSHGSGLEFAQYRAYEPGDEIRQLDWKLFARSDRLFVRDAERDSATQVWLLLDTTESMSQDDRARPGYRKLDCAKTLAAALVEIAIRQGDACGLMALSARAGQRIPALSGSRQRDRLLSALARIAPGGSPPEESALRGLASIPPQAVVIVFSDGFDEALVAAIEGLARSGRELRFVEMIAADERDFPFQGGWTVVDPETGAELQIDAAAVRERYLSRFADARAALAQRLAAAGIVQVTQVLDQAPIATLRRLLGAPRA